jgi:hypothetical protein
LHGIGSAGGSASSAGHSLIRVAPAPQAAGVDGMGRGGSNHASPRKAVDAASGAAGLDGTHGVPARTTMSLRACVTESIGRAKDLNECTPSSTAVDPCSCTAGALGKEASTTGNTNLAPVCEARPCGAVDAKQCTPHGSPPIVAKARFTSKGQLTRGGKPVYWK